VGGIMMKIKNSIKIFIQIFKDTFTLTKTTLIILMISGILTGLFPIIYNYIMSKVMQFFLLSKLEKCILLIILVFVLDIIIRFIGDYSNYEKEILNIKLQNYCKNKIINKMENVDYIRFEDIEFYNLFYAANSQIDTALFSVIEGTVQIFSLFITLFSYVAILLIANPLAIIVMIIFNIPYLLLGNKIYQNDKDFRFSIFKHVRKIDYFGSEIISDKSLFKEIRIFSLFSYIKNTLKTQFMEIEKKTKISKMKKLTYNSFVLISNRIGTILALILLFINGNKDYIMSNFLVVIAACTSFSSIINAFTQLFEFSRNGFLNLELFYEFINLDIRKENNDNIINLKESNTKLDDLFAIDISNVSFKYPTSNYVVSDISLKFKKGDIVFLVGENGCGKSTLVKLLTGLYTPSQGIIKYNDIDLKELGNSDYNHLLSCVFQDFGKYAVSVYDNVSFGNIQKKNDKIAIEQAAIESNADKFIKKLPNGYKTLLTKLFDDNGVDLSGGQWQKLAIGRSLFSDAKLLILDEPTASLDINAEYEFFKKIRENSTERITILVSHRLSSIKLTDKILYMENGKILESGTHVELIKLGTKYSDLYKKQFNY